MKADYVDFKEVKRSTTIDRLAEMLGMRPKKNRMMCPIAQNDPRELVINVEKNVWFCFSCKKGGSILELAAHVRQSTVKEAAHTIKAMVDGVNQPYKRGLPEDGLPYLQPDHAQVHKMGLDTATAAKLGVGHAPRGTMKGRTLFPLRDRTGRLLGYIGVAPGADIKLPSSFQEPSE
jgi:DNA primase